jgi:hypothetical protein
MTILHSRGDTFPLCSLLGVGGSLGDKFIYAVKMQTDMFSEPDQDHLAGSVLKYCRQRGFPHYNLSIEKKMQDFDTLRRFDIEKIIQDGCVNQSLHAMGLCWSYHPHHWGIRTRNMKTAVDVWENDDLLLKAIKSRIKWGGKVGENGFMSDSNLRKAIRTYSGVQRVSNFRPSAAAAIYKKYCPDGGAVWDMSSGFGGRLIGALASGVVSTYFGCDPSTPTFDGLNAMSRDFSGMIRIELAKEGSEVYLPPEPVDLCFTSPPYFDTEAYSQDFAQSCIAYPNVERWNHYFLRQTIRNCMTVLKNNRYMILNVANVASHKNLENDTVDIAHEEGFFLEDMLKLKLSSISFGKTHKTEPVFIFKKR